MRRNPLRWVERASSAKSASTLQRRGSGNSVVGRHDDLGRIALEHLGDTGYH